MQVPLATDWQCLSAGDQASQASQALPGFHLPCCVPSNLPALPVSAPGFHLHRRTAAPACCPRSLATHAPLPPDVNNGEWHMLTLSTFPNDTLGYSLYVDGQPVRIRWCKLAWVA